MNLRRRHLAVELSRGKIWTPDRQLLARHRRFWSQRLGGREPPLRLSDTDPHGLGQQALRRANRLPSGHAVRLQHRHDLVIDQRQPIAEPFEAAGELQHAKIGSTGEFDLEPIDQPIEICVQTT